MRRKLSFILPALVFLAFTALENVEVSAVADTVASFGGKDQPAQVDVVPAIYEAPARADCPRLRDA